VEFQGARRRAEFLDGSVQKWRKQDPLPGLPPGAKVRRPVGGFTESRTPIRGPRFFLPMPNLASSRIDHFDRARLLAVLEPIVLAHGAEMVDFEWKSEPGGWVLRIFVEKQGSAAANLSTEEASVGLELCAAVARDLSPALDVANLVDHRYHLEVSTPGVERPLRGPHDYARFEGKKARLKLKGGIAGQKVVTGILGPLTESSVSVNIGSKSHDIRFDDILFGQLVFEFGPAPKPGKKR
jgi:ribosome maturation factor RimP